MIKLPENVNPQLVHEWSHSRTNHVLLIKYMPGNTTLLISAVMAERAKHRLNHVWTLPTSMVLLKNHQ